jgi:hypothetical protein
MQIVFKGILPPFGWSAGNAYITPILFKTFRSETCARLRNYGKYSSVNHRTDSGKNTDCAIFRIPRKSAIHSRLPDTRCPVENPEWSAMPLRAGWATEHLHLPDQAEMMASDAADIRSFSEVTSGLSLRIVLGNRTNSAVFGIELLGG